MIGLNIICLMIDNNLLRLMERFLTIRTGVPQRYILGLLLYLTHFNDIGNSFTRNVLSFADVQKGTLRVIKNASYYSYTGPTFRKFRSLNLHDLFYYHALLFVHDYLPNKHPNSFKECFPTNSDMPNWRVTRQFKLLYVPNYPLKCPQRQQVGFLLTLWNKWNKSISEMASLSHTKRIIKFILLQDYLNVVRCENKRYFECHINFNLKHD